MEVDPTIASVLGVIGVLGSTGITVWANDRRATRKEAAEQRAAATAERARLEAAAANHSADVYARTTELMEIIDEKVNDATKELRGELGEVKRLVGSLYGRLSRTREAVRAYIRLVRAQWGKSEMPPPIDGHLLELLGDDEMDDTFTAEQIAKIVDEQPG